jgi:hypothetical protein
VTGGTWRPEPVLNPVASQSDHARDRQAIAALAARFLLTTPPSDRALAGWGIPQYSKQDGRADA